MAELSHWKNVHLYHGVHLSEKQELLCQWDVVVWQWLYPDWLGYYLLFQTVTPSSQFDLFLLVVCLMRNALLRICCLQYQSTQYIS
jgi:hypothetical protein